MKGQVCIRGEGFSGLGPDVVLGLFDAMGQVGWGGSRWQVDFGLVVERDQLLGRVRLRIRGA